MEGGNRKIAEDEAGPSSSSGIAASKQQNPHETFHHHHHHHYRKEAEEEDETEEEEEDDLDHHKNTAFVPGPLLSLKDQIERDKEDESLRRWKEKLLGCMESELDGQIDPEVKFHSIGIISEDFGEVITPLPVDENKNGHILFTLREGSQYQLKLKFSVLHNIVSGLTYCNTVWKGGLQVEQSRGMLGTFAPQKEPYVHALKEDITPSGVLARGVYSAKLKFEDDDRRCHMELKYSLEIKKR
ncbi:rho GDP-dissociation inhibitor 1 [Cajanus cajan]|uniref:Rho GDP-dissociation inhibitor 1 n=1 Tax=Cajanus cajan TaxID=3821 RepID=A0A151U4B4_CAJCA|nr:rho GDP-dissociation inhibitor 1 [Cajanus cajan]KYP74143.1 Rho GDP-dissociation inhibitor 1 [Cajanus cajan]